MPKPVLHDYQQTALDFSMHRLYIQDDLGAGLLLDPGLGKTLVTLQLLAQLRALGEIRNALIVAPLRVCQLVWGQESEKWGFNFQMNMHCQRVKAGLKKQGFIDLINPESLHLLEGVGRWDMLVVDESTKFKNWTCKRMKAMRRMLPDFKKRLILTGTPAPNSLADLHGQAYIVDDGVALGRNVTVFRSKYQYQGGWQGRQWVMRHGQEQPIQDAIAPLCIRLDAETCLDMPELVMNVVECEMPQSCKARYAQLKRELLAQLETGTVFAQNAASAYMKCRQFANGRMYDEDRNVHDIHTVKREALCDLVGELQGKPLLTFYQFDHDRTALLEKFPKAGVMNGRSKKTDAATIKDWNAGKLHMLIAQNQAISHGLNMQECGADMAYYGMNDSLEVFDQSFRRIYRQGFKGKQVRVHKFLTRGTVDGIINQRIVDKNTNQREFLDALRNHARAA